MNIGIVGLGLIGGSLAKAYKRGNNIVFGEDKDELTLQFAVMAHVIDGNLTDERLKDCDLIMLAITPMAAIKWFREKAPLISKETVIIDCCGTKRLVCEENFKTAEAFGLAYIGGHPMAGKERGGFKNSSDDLFDEQPFIMVPKDRNDMAFLCKVKEMIKGAGFGRIAVTTPKEHDQVIAFTSQMPHIVSNGFIKSKTALKDSKILSAGSYRDFTRVAFLDETMWTELFMENREFLLEELQGLIKELKKYEDALSEEDSDALKRLLAEGRECKAEVDRKCV